VDHDGNWSEGLEAQVQGGTKHVENDPFRVLDRGGVGELVQMGTDRGRAAFGSLKIGICGEHGGEPSSVRFCYNLGLDYVSCSPYRVPVARLAAAQAALAGDRTNLPPEAPSGDGASARAAG